MNRSIILLALATLATSCIKDELPVPAVPRSEAQEVQLCMGQGYQQQYWLDLSSGQVVRENSVMAWDLAFESAPDGWRIMLNGGRLMMAWNSGESTIGAPLDVYAVALEGSIDSPNGHPDSTAFGDWRSSSTVYVLDMGYDGEGNVLGHRRVRPISVDASGYTVEVAMADGSGATVVTIPKDGQRSWVHFKLGQGVVQVAPPNGAWDIVLTRYTHIFRDIDLPYLVVGAFIDGTTTRVARVTGTTMASVSLADTLQFPFRQERDAIGYDWKEYSFETSSYTVDIGIVYIVQDAEGVYHKLQFLDFYNAMGQPGCPSFTMARF